MIKVEYNDDYIELSTEDGEAKLTARILNEDSIEYEIEDLSEETKNKFYSITKYHDLVLVENLFVEKQFRGKGFAGILLKELEKIVRSKNFKFLYLNACPILGEFALDLESLEEFYAKHGFKAFLNQENNTLMIKDLK